MVKPVELPPIASSRVGGAPPPPEGGLLGVLNVAFESKTPRPEQQKKKPDVKAEKKKADEVIANLKKGIFPKAEIPQTPEIQEGILREQLASGNTQGLIEKAQDIPEDPKMLGVLTDILIAPPELQNDPRWLLAKGSEIRNALRADMPNDQQRIARNILRNIYQKIAVIEGVDTSSPQVRISKDPVVAEKVQFVELAGNSLLPEAGVMPPPAPPSAVENIFQDSGDPLDGSFLEKTLKDIQTRLSTDPDPRFHNTHSLAQYEKEIEDLHLKHTRYDSPEVMAQVREAKRRIQAVIDETLAAQQTRELARGREPRIRVDEKDRDWLCKKDELPLDDEIEIDGKKVKRNLKPLRDMLEDFSDYGYVNDPHTLQMMASKLRELSLGNKTNVSSRDTEKYIEKITRHYRVIRGLHWQPDGVDMRNIREDWRKRDKLFYERINNVLTDRFEQSRQVMNLYSEGGVDAFIEAVEAECGQEVSGHYKHLKTSIYFMHDLEQIARGPAGDVELLKKLVHMSQTSFMTEGTTDPITVAMIVSYEQALRKFLHDHDGYLPPSLFEFNRVTHKNDWDDLAMKFFEAKVKSGQLFDYKRYKKGEKQDYDGLGVPRGDMVGFQKGELFSETDLKTQDLRIEAARHMAKGIGIFDHRLLELFAKAKAPGEETSHATFSSIPYEGISRFFRPHGHLFGKYDMGELSHDPVFNTLFGGEKIPTMLNFLHWTPEDWEEVKKASFAGDLEDWIMNKYGQKKGTEVLSHVKPFLDIMEEFSWTGRFGPHSGWGEIDSTLYWTDRQREMEGGSIRISRAMWWAKRYAEGGNLSGWESLTSAEKDKKLNQLARAYGTWVWAQMVLRSPQTAAENVFMTEDGVQKMGKKRVSDLRKALIGEILHIDLDSQVTTEATPNASQRAYMDRITILDTDIAAIQHAALYGGSNGEPREITDDDINILKGDLDDPEHQGQKVTEETRRQQAKAYIERVRKELLGDQWRTMRDVEQALGISFGAANVKDLKKNIVPMKDMLHIANFENIDDILAQVKQNGGRLSAELIARPQDIFMGMDDTRLGDMDISNLGARAFARLTNDLEARKTAITYMQELLGEFKPKMNEKKVFELLEKLYIAEKAGRGPGSAQAFVYYFARLFGEYYRGDKYTKIPIVGRILQRYGPPSSVAQKVWKKEIGDVWSINNEKAFLRQVAQIGGLPMEEIEANGTHNKYSIKRLENELVAGNAWAIAEMVIIGAVLTAMMISFSAVTKQIEEEKN